MNKIYFYLILALMGVSSSCPAQKLTSPDKKLAFNLYCSKQKVSYTLSRGKEIVVNSSKLGLILQNVDLTKKLTVKEVKYNSFHEVWNQPWGEETSIDNTYNEMRVSLQSVNKQTMVLAVRLFNDGLGFRYEIPQQTGLDKITIMDEVTEFNVPQKTVSWSIPSNHTSYYEGIYRKMNICDLDTVCTPLTMQINDRLYITIHEAALTDYAKINLYPEKGNHKLRAYLTPWSTGEKVFAENSLFSPWRTIIVADKPGDLLLSRLMLNLNEPCKLSDTSWIESGRYIGIWWAIHMGKYSWAQGAKHGATTENTKKYIDFAAKHGFSGVLAEGWNTGWDGDWTKDGDLFSFTESSSDFNLAEVAAYAKSKGVRFIAHNETGGASMNLEKQMDKAFPLYESLGINCVKTGYVGSLIDGKEKHDSQYGVRHYRKVVETAARYHLMIDNHEPVMPTGIQRTYPNLMTQEGVRGQEYNAWSTDGGNPPSHTVTLPFTRGLAGPMDYTPNVLNHHNEVHSETQPGTTNAGELALNVILYSPLQMAADMIENYECNPALEFISACPTNWSHTVVPEASIGKYITIARKERNGERWFLGAITDENPRISNISLDFLDKGASYKAKIFSDSEGAHFHNNPYALRISEQIVTAKSTLKLAILAGGGAAIIFEKIK